MKIGLLYPIESNRLEISFFQARERVHSVHRKYAWMQFSMPHCSVLLSQKSRKKGGVLMAKIDAYAYYLSTYGQNRPTRYDSHKKSDLRKIYNAIVKTNREAPLYKLSGEDEVAKYAIDIKENAKAIQNVVASLSDSYGDFSDSFRKKVAISSDEETVGVKYIGDGTEAIELESFNIEVKQLSSPQINTGNFLRNEGLSFIPGTYSFDLNINYAAYEFQFNVNSGESNLDVMRKLAGLVNRSSLGINATIKHGTTELGEPASALNLTSRQMGRNGEEPIFTIKPGPSSESIQFLGLLGIEHITKQAENSHFLVNGEELESLSNSFTVNNTFELSLNQVSKEGQVAEISFKTDIDAVADNVMSLINAFNRILQIAESSSTEATGDTNKLLNEMSSVSRSRRESLGEIGLEVAENGTIALNKEKLEAAIQPDRADKTFGRLSSFKNAIGAKADAVAINPMNYVNKVVVNYKNPGHTFTAPYFSSVYSGMMLDRYI